MLGDLLGLAPAVLVALGFCLLLVLPFRSKQKSRTSTVIPIREEVISPVPYLCPVNDDVLLGRLLTKEKVRALSSDEDDDNTPLTSLKNKPSLFSSAKKRGPLFKHLGVLRGVVSTGDAHSFSSALLCASPSKFPSPPQHPPCYLDLLPEDMFTVICPYLTLREVFNLEQTAKSQRSIIADSDGMEYVMKNEARERYPAIDGLYSLLSGKLNSKLKTRQRIKQQQESRRVKPFSRKLTKKAAARKLARDYVYQVELSLGSKTLSYACRGKTKICEHSSQVVVSLVGPSPVAGSRAVAAAVPSFDCWKDVRSYGEAGEAEYDAERRRRDGATADDVGPDRDDDGEDGTLAIKVFVTKFNDGEGRLLLSSCEIDDDGDTIFFEEQPCRGTGWELFGNKHCDCNFTPAVIMAAVDREYVEGTKSSTGEKTFFETFKEVRLHFATRDHEDEETMSARQIMFCIRSIFDDE